MLRKSNYIFIVLWIFSILVLLGLNFLGFSEKIKLDYSNITQIILAFCAAIFGFIAYLGHAKGTYRRTVWLFFALGLFLWGIGNTLYYGYIILTNSEPSLSYFGHLFFISTYICFILGYFTFFDRSHYNIPIIASIIALIIVFAGLVSSYYLHMFDPLQTVPFLVSSAFGMLSPITFAALVFITIIILANRSSPAWWLVIIGMTCLFIAERSTLFFTVNTTYQSGQITDVFWLLAFGFIMLAAMVSYNMSHNLKRA